MQPTGGPATPAATHARLADEGERGQRIWVTRAQPGADATGARLRTLGYQPVVESLLVVHPLALPNDPPEGFAALAFTSANAVHAFAAWTPQRRWPVFAVGAATAQAAREAGFERVNSADGDVGALALQIAAQPPAGGVLHPCAREAAGDLTGVLGASGVQVRALALYETRPVQDLPTSVSDPLHHGAVSAVLVHSPRAAATLATLLAGSLAFDFTKVRLLGLSAACLAPLTGVTFASAAAPSEPNEAAMLELLR